MNEVSGVLDVLGLLGAYFSVVLVLAVAVETILDSIKLNRWLNDKIAISKWFKFLDVQRKTISPDEAMRDIAFWVPPKSQAEVKIAALNNLVEQSAVALEQLGKVADAGLQTAQQLVQLGGLTRQEALLRANIAQKLYIMRQVYSAQETERIARLRRVSALLGIGIALLLRLDTFAFLAPLFPTGMQVWMAQPYMVFFGMVLTGTAASMGSAFWHEQLDKMRAVKQSARTLQSITATAADG